MHQELNDFLKAHNVKESTKKNYQTNLKVFSSWLEQQGLHPHDVTRRDLKRYISYMDDELDYAPMTARGNFKTVKVYYNEEVKDGIIEENPAEKLKKGDAAQQKTLIEDNHDTERVFLTEEEIQSVIQHAPEPKIRNRTIISFQYQTGLRRGEVANVRLENLDREERQVTVVGKGDKTINAYWSSSLDALLNSYIDIYRKKSSLAQQSPYLFLSEFNEKISGYRVNDVVKQAAEKAGIQEVLYETAGGQKRHKITSHAIRHTFGAHWLKRGGSTEGLQHRFAHTDASTTEIYKHMLDEWVQEESEAVGVGSDIEVSTEIDIQE